MAFSYEQVKEKTKTGGSGLYERVKQKVQQPEPFDIGSILVSPIVQGATAEMIRKEREKTDIQKLSEQLKGRETEIRKAPEKSIFEKAGERISEILPKGTTPTETVQSLFGRAPLVREVAQGFARDLSALFKGGETFTPLTEQERLVFGEKPFNLETVGREYADIVGKGEDINRRSAMGIGVFAGVLSLPFRAAGLVKESSKVISGLENTSLVKNELKRLGVQGTEKEINALADVLSAESHPRVIEDILESFKEQKFLPEPEGLPKVPREQKTPEEIAKPTVERGRLRELDTQIKDIDKQIDTLSKQDTPANTRRIEQLTKKRDVLDSQRASLVSPDELAEIRGKAQVTKRDVETAVKRGLQEGRIQMRAEIMDALRVTTKEIKDIKKQITDYVKDNLGTQNRGKALVMLRDAKNQKDLTKAFARVEKWADDATKKGLRDDILKTQKRIATSPAVAVDYKEQVNELLSGIELKGRSKKTIEKLEKAREFFAKEAEAGKDVEIPKRLLKSLNALNRTPFDEITSSQLKGIKADIELLEDIGRAKARTFDNVKRIEKEKILKEIEVQGAEPLNQIKVLRPEVGERLTVTQKMKNFVWSQANRMARVDKAITPMDSIFDLLDGGKASYDGANYRFFKGRIDAGYGRYLQRKDALQEPVIELANKYKFDERNFERIGVVAAREQDGGLEKLLASDFTEEQVNAVKLTKQEQEVLDKMRETFDSQFPEIKDTMRRVYNQKVEKVKNYFSFMTDWKAMDETEVFQRFGSQEPEQFGAPKKNVEAGFAKARVGGDQRIKINALDVFMQHTDNTSYLLELGEMTKSLGEIAASPRYAELVGEQGQLLVREWLDTIARKGGAAGAQEISLLNTLRKNVGAGILGLKLSTVAIQPTALFDGVGFIGTKYTLRGSSDFVTNKQIREYTTKMPEIKDRMGGEAALRELSDDNWLQNVQMKGFMPMQTVDQWTAGSIAWGAYVKKMRELGRVIDTTKPYDTEALAYAQLAVRRTQSSGAFKDVPLAVSRGALTGNRSLDRAILQFQTFLLNRWSRIRHDAWRAGIREKDPKKAIPILTSIIMASIAGSGIRLGVNKTIDFITGKEDEDSVEEELKRGFIYEMTGNVPFLGTAVSMAVYDGEMFPILDAPKGVVSGLNRVITSDSEQAKLRGLTELTGSMGAMLGIPGSIQAEQLARGVLQEKKKPARAKSIPTPPGLPKLPSVKSTLPAPPGLPKI